MEAPVKPMHEALDVAVSEHGAKLTLHLKGSLEDADLEDARHAFARLPPLAGRTVELTVEPQALKTRGNVVLDFFCRLMEKAGARVAIRADAGTRAALASFVAPAREPKKQEGGDLLARVARFQRGLTESLIAYLDVSRRTLGAVVGALFRRSRFDFDDFFLALKEWGLGAVPLIAIISALIGGTLALEAGPFFAMYGQEIYVPRLVAKSLLRGIGPLLTAILIAGRSGSTLAAEIGTMKVSEEVDALTVMGADPVRVLIAPRFLALLCALPCLVILADLLGIVGGLVAGKLALDLPVTLYIDETRKAVELKDVVAGLLKALAYAVTIVTIAAHQGFATKGGAAGVGRHTTRSVVVGIMWIIAVDAFFSLMLYLMDL
jgi:phospholipid/cholesterol/gamma-HCH transport system permease protein